MHPSIWRVHSCGFPEIPLGTTRSLLPTAVLRKNSIQRFSTQCNSGLVGVPALLLSKKVTPPLRSMQKISLPSVCIFDSILKPRRSTHSRRLRSRSALGIIGMHDSTVMRISLSHTMSPTKGRKMKSQPKAAGKAASELISERIAELGDWRGDTLTGLRPQPDEHAPWANERRTNLTHSRELLPLKMSSKDALPHQGGRR